jgi:Protein of unknown function (DUF541).
MKKILLFLSLVLSVNVLANDIVIKTNSKVTKELKADSAKINFKVKTLDKEKEKAQIDNKRKMERFLNELKEKGIKYDSLVNENYRYYKIVNNIGKGLESKIYITELTLSTKVNGALLANIIDIVDKIGGIEYKINKGMLTLNIKNESRSKEENLNIIYEKVDKILEYINRDFDFENILNYEKYSNEKEDLYNIETSISLKLRDLSRISDVVQIAQKNNVELTGSIDYSVSNLKDEYLKMYKESYDKAKNKNFYLIDKAYKFKEVKNISEDRYLVDSLNRKINISNNEDEYVVDSYSTTRAMKSIALSSYENDSLDENDKNIIDIPRVNLENSLNIEFVVTDGKKDSYDNKAKIYVDVNKMVKVDLAELNFVITTESLEDFESAGKENAKILDKIKRVLSDAEINFDKFETEEYKTEKVYEYKNITNNLGNVGNEANILLKVQGINTKNYKQFIGILEKNNSQLIKNNIDLFISIKDIDKNAKIAYENTIKKSNKIKTELSKIGINSNISEYTNKKIENIKNENIKDEKYKVINSVKLVTSDVKNISQLISLLSEMGIKVNGINYKVKNIDKYEKEIYNELLKEIEMKKNSLNEIGDFKVVNISSLEQVESILDNNFYKKIYVNSKNKIDLNRTNKDIIDSALKNLESIKIAPYNMELGYEVILNIK